MRFHSLAVPHNICHPDYVACAYQMKVLKFAAMMTARGHEVITYGVAGMQTESTEEVEVVDRDTFERVYGDHDYRSKLFRYDLQDDVYQMFYRRAAEEIRRRAQPGDFVLPFWGVGHRAVTDAVADRAICVEPGIGYASGHWAAYKIFESYAIYHAYCGLEAVGSCRQSFYDVVIPNYFDHRDFDFRPQDKKDYMLFLGRVYSGKGLDIAIQVARETGLDLVVAGQGSLREAGYQDIPPNVHEYGYAGVEDRRRLMAEARVSMVASLYTEPFGGVQVENLFSGTPTVTTDWGAFTENNIHGVTGYRCRTFDDFCWAVENIDRIDPQQCRDFAMANFAFDAIAPRYEEFFENVLDVHNSTGWYQRHPERSTRALCAGRQL